MTSLRELSDGRVLMTDGREQRFLILDFAKQTAEPIGRKGNGPNEYSMVFQLHPAGGDSSVMGDILLRRLLLLDGPRVVATVPPDHPALVATKGYVFGSDALGRILSFDLAEPPNGVSTTTLADSQIVLLVNRARAGVDSMARLRKAPTRREVQRDDKKVIRSSSNMVIGEFPSEEKAILFADGWLGIARLEPFRVDWRAADGKWVRGAALPVKRIPVDAREKSAHAGRRAAAQAQQGPLPRNMPPQPGLGEYPEFVPPFGISSVLVAGPAGLLIIKRHTSADYTASHYFVVDRAGKLVGELSLPANETIVGAGPKSLYIAVKDEDDVIRLRRHPW
ncbi:MAG: hypothetical protein IT357_15145 [Gemmatimonadaceae bacterium]|nr:hypothetical protein [Gemmatimonadaceae bacterium]